MSIKPLEPIAAPGAQAPAQLFVSTKKESSHEQ